MRARVRASERMREKKTRTPTHARGERERGRMIASTLRHKDTSLAPAHRHSLLERLQIDFERSQIEVDVVVVVEFDAAVELAPVRHLRRERKRECE